MLALLQATIHVVYLILTVLLPSGLAASPPRLLVQQDLQTCLAQQHNAVMEAEKGGLAHFSVACADMIASPGGAVLDSFPVPSNEGDNNGE